MFINVRFKKTERRLKLQILYEILNITLKCDFVALKQKNLLTYRKLILLIYYKKYYFLKLPGISIRLLFSLRKVKNRFWCWKHCLTAYGKVLRWFAFQLRCDWDITQLIACVLPATNASTISHLVNFSYFPKY